MIGIFWTPPNKHNWAAQYIAERRHEDERQRHEIMMRSPDGCAYGYEWRDRDGNRTEYWCGGPKAKADQRARDAGWPGHDGAWWRYLMDDLKAWWKR